MPKFLQDHRRLSGKDLAVKMILIIIIALALPFPLIILEKTVLPYPEFAEEIAKGLVVFLILVTLYSCRQKIFAGFIFGFLFGWLENIAYLPDIMGGGDLAFFWKRALIVMPMHILTVLIMILSGCKNKWFLIFGLAAAIALHILFNRAAAFF